MTRAEMLRDNKALMRDIVAMFATGDLFAVTSVIAARYIDHQGLPGIDIIGPHGFSCGVIAARSTFSDLRVSIEDLIGEDDRVARCLQWHGIRLAGGKLDRETVDIVRFANDQAVEHWGIRLWISEESGPSSDDGS